MTVTDVDHNHRHDHDLDHHDGHHHGHPRTSVSPSGAGSGRSFLVERCRSIIGTPWGIGLLAVAAVLVIDAGGSDDSAGVCVFRRCTGGYCPGCGMTRSARHLTRGELGAAWHDHPILVLLAIQAVVGALVFASVRRLRARLRTPRTLAVLAGANGVLLLLIWVIRLIDGSIPRFF